MLLSMSGYLPEIQPMENGMVDIVNGFTVYWDCPLEERYEHGPKKGQIIRRSKDFRGKGCKGRANIFLRTVKNYNPKIEKCSWLMV